MGTPHLADLADEVRRHVRIMVGAALTIAVAAATWAFYSWRYERAPCQTTHMDYTFADGEHDTYFGCTWTGGRTGGWEDGNIWTNRIAVGLLGLALVGVLVFFVANWNHSAARYRLQRAYAERPSGPDFPGP